MLFRSRETTCNQRAHNATPPNQRRKRHENASNNFSDFFAIVNHPCESLSQRAHGKAGGEPVRAPCFGLDSLFQRNCEILANAVACFTTAQSFAKMATFELRSKTSETQRRAGNLTFKNFIKGAKKKRACMRTQGCQRKNRGNQIRTVLRARN